MGVLVSAWMMRICQEPDGTKARSAIPTPAPPLTTQLGRPRHTLGETGSPNIS